MPETNKSDSQVAYLFFTQAKLKQEQEGTLFKTQLEYACALVDIICLGNT